MKKRITTVLEVETEDPVMVTDDFIKCSECKWQDNCPVMWSYLNAACITIQKRKIEVT